MHIYTQVLMMKKPSKYITVQWTELGSLQKALRWNNTTNIVIVSNTVVSLGSHVKHSLLIPKETKAQRLIISRLGRDDVYKQTAGVTEEIGDLTHLCNAVNQAIGIYLCINQYNPFSN